jgi:hypothetical protein
MLSFFAARAQSSTPVAQRGAGTPARKPATPAKKPVTPAKKPANGALGKDQLSLSGAATKKPTPAPVKPTPAPVKPAPPPEPPVAETIEKAVEMALKGEAVRAPIPFRDPRRLTIKTLESTDGASRYEATLGDQKLTLTVAAGQPGEATVAKAIAMVVAAPTTMREAITAVRVDDANEATARFTVDSSDFHGTPASVSFKRTGDEGAFAAFEVVDDGFKVKLLLPAEQTDRTYGLAQAAWLYDQVPEPMRPVIDTIEVNAGRNPQDTMWEEQYKMAGFRSAATAGGGVIHFWNGTANMATDTFNHEFGHLLAQKLTNGKSFVPVGWEAAIAADGQTVSEYAKASPTEDFAETWSLYAKLKSGANVYVQNARTMADFEKNFPARAKIMTAAWAAASKGIITQAEVESFMKVEAANAAEAARIAEQAKSAKPEAASATPATEPVATVTVEVTGAAR